MYATQAFTTEQIREYIFNMGYVDRATGNVYEPMGIYQDAAREGISARQIDAALIGFSPGWTWGTANQWIASNGLAPLRTDAPSAPPPVVSPPVGVVTPAPSPAWPSPPPSTPLPRPGPSTPGVATPQPVFLTPAPPPPVVTVPGTAPPVQAGPAPAVPPLTAPGGPGTVPGPIPGTPEAQTPTGAPAGPGALTLLAIAAAAAFLA